MVLPAILDPFAKGAAPAVMTRLALDWTNKATVIAPILDRRPGVRGIGFIIRPPRNSSTTLLAFLPPRKHSDRCVWFAVAREIQARRRPGRSTSSSTSKRLQARVALSVAAVAIAQPEGDMRGPDHAESSSPKPASRPCRSPAAWLAISARTPFLAIPTRDGTDPPAGETVAYDDRPARTGHAALPAKTSAPRAVSPCWLRSRPSCSCSAVTRRGMIRSVSL